MNLLSCVVEIKVKCIFFCHSFVFLSDPTEYEFAAATQEYSVGVPDVASMAAARTFTPAVR